MGILAMGRRLHGRPAHFIEGARQQADNHISRRSARDRKPWSSRPVRTLVTGDDGITRIPGIVYRAESIYSDECSSALLKAMEPKSAVTFTVLLLLSTFVVAQQSAPEAASQLSANQIVQNMVARNGERAQALKQYTSVRTYQCSYTGIGGDRQATMTVQARYVAPDKKDFVVVAQQGSELIINRVFRRLLESEKEASDEENRSETALNSSNYNFSLLAFEDTPEGRFYVLAVEPKVENKFLYRGKIWVEANDFAVARIEAEPAKKPSFWIKQTEIRHRYAKIGEFWLPAENRSTSRVRLGGTATLTIEYRNYSVNSSASGSDQSAAEAVGARLRR